MRLATWRPVKPLPHAAFAAFEREDIPAMAVLVWQHDVGWVFSIRIEGSIQREVGQMIIASADAPQPEIGDAVFGWADDLAERATR